MKTKIYLLFFLLTITSCKKPTEYYSKAVYAGNMAMAYSKWNLELNELKPVYNQNRST